MEPENAPPQPQPTTEPKITAGTPEAPPPPPEPPPLLAVPQTLPVTPLGGPRPPEAQPPRLQVTPGPPTDYGQVPLMRPPASPMATGEDAVSLPHLPPVARISKGLVLALIIGGLAVGYALMVGGAIAPVLTEDEDVAVVSMLALFGPGLLAAIGAGIAWLWLLYKAWSAIQDGYERTTPLQAVGFMFIPFYNLYWIFQAVHGLAQDLNAFAVRHRLSTAGVNEQVFLWLCIAWLFSGLPYIGACGSIALFVLIAIAAGNLIDAVNSISDDQRRAGLAVAAGPQYSALQT